jgi:alpha/beta hydrolase fold
MKNLIACAALLLAGHCFANEEHHFNVETIMGNGIAWSCEGSGTPTVVLMAGGGLDVHSSFDMVYHEYNGKGTICMYDRAGIGSSTFKEPKLRKMDDLVEEFHQLKQKRGWKDLVLVPHSFGGFIARGYVSKYPTDVKAVLFIDIAHEDWIPNLKKKMSMDDWSIMDSIIKWNSKTFHEDYIEGQESARAFAFNNKLPITVISRGIPLTKIRRNKMSYEGIGIFNKEHNRGQKNIAKLSRNSKHVISKISPHEIGSYDPWLVLDEIKSLLERI